MLSVNVIIHGVVKVSYFSQLNIHGEFINSLSSYEGGFISSIRIVGFHGSLLRASNNAAVGVFRTLSNI